MTTRLPSLLREVRSCRICEAHLPLGPRPVLQLSGTARVVIVGQAPGTRVHESGKPWDDPSGEHLREWLAMDPETFYDPSRVAHLPMGFCYPGKKPGGDAPPRPECAPAWHAKLRARLPSDHLMLLAGMYAHKAYLARARKRTLGETVRAFETYLPEFLPLPHPSWRSRLFRQKNPWFDAKLLPRLREEVDRRL